MKEFFLSIPLELDLTFGRTISKLWIFALKRVKNSRKRISISGRDLDYEIVIIVQKVWNRSLFFSQFFREKSDGVKDLLNLNFHKTWLFQNEDISL